MFITPARKDLLKKHNIAVEREFDMVRIKFGNVSVKVHYETAFLLSQWIRMQGKEAKRFAGDTSRHYSAIGIMHDANYGPDHTRG